MQSAAIISFGLPQNRPLIHDTVWPVRSTWLRILLGSALLAGCASVTPPPRTLTVFAAASLRAAFTELGAQFEAAHAEVVVSFNFAGSQQLAVQLREGAPADVFASASDRQMQAAIESERVAPESPQAFARNRLVVIYARDNAAPLSALPDLARPGLKLILAAKEVPVGQYTLDFLDKAQADPAFHPGYKEAVLSNVVSYEENVRVVLSKVALGEADGGIVYASDVSGEGVTGVGRIEVPDHLNPLATYPIAPIGDSAQAELARAFVEFVLSPDGQATLSRHGFIAAKP